MKQGYKAYLDTFLTEKDREYLFDIDMARKIVLLGLRGHVKPPYDPKKELLPRQQVFTKTSELGRILCEREAKIISEKLDAILFIKRNHVSAFVDLRDRIQKKNGSLIPSKCDLSFVNWNTGESHFKKTDQFDIVPQAKSLHFKHIALRHTIVPGQGGKDVITTPFKVPGYEKVVLYEVPLSIQ